MTLNRRHFLLGSASASACLAFSPFNRPARAQSSEYKALVYLFFNGGLDNWDTIIPFDGPAYDRYSQIRQSLLSIDPSYRARSGLLPLNMSGFEGRQFALPAEMSGLHGLFESGRAAIIGNVGPLIESVTRGSFKDGSVRLPARLFSHNDQVATWSSFAPEGGAQFGWGGLFADALRSVNEAPEFSAITTGQSKLFLTGRSVSPYEISANGAVPRNLFTTNREETEGTAALPFYDRLENQPARVRTLTNQRFRDERVRNHSIVNDVAAATRAASTANARYNRATKGATGVTTRFPEGGLGTKLQAVADAIAARSSLGMSRQVFLVSMPGFDTHSDQVNALPRMQGEVSGAITSFQSAMESLGISEQVTLCTASDFGRSLAVNGDGTDHGWGGHSFVVGGAVRGGTVYGELPPADFGHERDAGGGRLIPSTSVESYAASLGRWLGLNDDALRTALPGWGGSTIGVLG
ncbi:MAG: DUF1501 domain-containing protein [Myxococcota bacterium]